MATYWFVLFFLVFTGSDAVNKSTYVELSLKNHILPDGELLVRPVINQEDTVNVTMGLAINQLIDMDEVNQILTTSMWIRIFWTNPFITWNPKEYQGISSLNIDPSKLWTPDIVLINSVHEERSANLQKEMDTSLKLSHTGDIKWQCPFICKTECQINIRDFPFDYQQCKLSFSSWTYDGLELDLSVAPNGSDITAYVENGEWILDGMTDVRTVGYFSGKPFPSVSFKLDLERRSLYYIFNLIIPCLAITFLAFLSFILPPDAGERVGLVMTVLLSMSVFLLIVADSVPTTSVEVPLISRFFIALMMEIGVSLVFTCFLLRLHYLQPKSRLPRWLKFLVYNIISPLVCCHRSKSCKPCDDDESNNVFINSFPMHPFENGHVHHPKNISESEPELSTSRENKTSRKTKLTNEGKALLEGITTLANHKRDKLKQEEIEDEWNEAVLIIDRLLFFVFFLTSLLTCILIFSQAPFFLN